MRGNTPRIRLADISMSSWFQKNFWRFWMFIFVCEEVFTTTTTSTVQTMPKCEDDTYTFIRTPGVTLSVPPLGTLPIGNVEFSIKSCIELCKNSSSCAAFKIDYSARECISFGKDSLERQANLRSKLGITLYEAVCLPKDKVSTGLYAFERHLDMTMVLSPDKEISRVKSHVACAFACINEESFTCLSMVYHWNEKKCLLSKQNRLTRKDGFETVRGSQWQYLEIINLTGPQNCEIEAPINSTLQSIELSYTSDSIEDCRDRCAKETQFFCVSYAFHEAQKRCLISPDQLVNNNEWNLLLETDEYTVEQRNCSIDTCYRKQHTFIKTKNAKLIEKEEIILTDSQQIMITSNCLAHCRHLGKTQCQAVEVDYEKKQCYRFTGSELTDDDLEPTKNTSVFEHVCLMESKNGCQKYDWLFERSKSHELQSITEKALIKPILERTHCIEACLHQTNFTCRSIVFDKSNSECHLSSELTEQSAPTYFESTNSSVDQLDLTCLQDHQCYFKRRSGVSSLHVDVAISDVKSIPECQKFCSDHEKFACKLINYNPQLELCELSSDNDITTSKDSQTICYEKVCNPRDSILNREDISDEELIAEDTKFSPFPAPKSSIPSRKLQTEVQHLLPLDYKGGKCPSLVKGALRFEKVTGYRVLGTHGDEVYHNKSRGITVVCLEKCDKDIQNCDTLTLDYLSGRCIAYQPQMQRSNEIEAVEKVPAFSYFKPICFRSQHNCPRLWVIERFIHQKLLVNPIQELMNISKYECQAQCFANDDCQSANYYRNSRKCELNNDDRFSAPNEFQEADDVEYLENQCYSAKEIRARQFNTGCQYINSIKDKYLVFVDKTTPANSEAECRAACGSEVIFNCRSYSFVLQSQGNGPQCYLSADTQNSVGAQLLDMPGAVYAERICNSQNIEAVPTNPSIITRPPLPFPQFPGQPFPPQAAPFPGLFPGPGFPPAPPGTGFFPGPARCFYPTDFTFEKTMGMVPRPMGFMARVEPMPLRGPQSIAPDCLRQCTERDVRCMAFVEQYPMGAEASCIAFNRGIGPERALLMPRKDATLFEKICLRGRRCNKMWTFERVVGFAIEGSDTRELRFVLTKEDCEDHCLSEGSFECRSAEYIYSMQICRLSTETRRSRPEMFHYVGPDVDYLENQCASEPVQCEYQNFPAKMLPYADRFLPSITTIEDCQQMCEKEKEFLCRSVSWNYETTDCLLSDDDRYSTIMGVNAIADRPSWVYSEKGNCGQVRVDCTPSEMLATVVFGQPFSGRVYAKGNPMCTMPGNSRMMVVLSVPLGMQCGTMQEAPGKYTNEIVIQQHPVIMTDSDKTYRIMCSFNAVDKIVTMGGDRIDGGGLDVIAPVVSARNGPPPLIENTAPTPNVFLRITSRNGMDVATVAIGDELLFRLEPDPNSAFGIFARNLVAKSEFGDYLPLLDATGCPPDPNIFPPLIPEPGTRTLIAPFRAFRFASTGRVNFEVQVTFCQDMCPPVQCFAGIATMGRRKRSETDENIQSNHTCMFDKSQTLANVLNTNDSTLNTSELNARDDVQVNQQPQTGSAVFPVSSASANRPQVQLPPPITVQGNFGGNTPQTNQRPPLPNHPQEVPAPHHPNLLIHSQQLPSRPQELPPRPQEFPPRPQEFPPRPQDFPHRPQELYPQQQPNHQFPHQQPFNMFQNHPHQTMANPHSFQSHNPYSPSFNASTFRPYNNNMEPQRPYSFYTNITPTSWQTSIPTEIPLPQRPAVKPVYSYPMSVAPPSASPVPPSTGENSTSSSTKANDESVGKETFPQVPLRVSLVVNNQEDDRSPERPRINFNPGPSPSVRPVSPNYYMNRYDGPIIRVPSNPSVSTGDKTCTEKSTIVTSVLSTIVIQLTLMGVAIFVYKRYKKKKKKTKTGLGSSGTPVGALQNVLYGPSAAFHNMGIRDKVQSGHSTLKVTNWIQQQERQQRTTRDPNRINIMDMA